MRPPRPLSSSRRRFHPRHEGSEGLVRGGDWETRDGEARDGVGERGEGSRGGGGRGAEEASSIVWPAAEAGGVGSLEGREGEEGAGAAA